MDSNYCINDIPDIILSWWFLANQTCFEKMLLIWKTYQKFWQNLTLFKLDKTIFLQNNIVIFITIFIFKTWLKYFFPEWFCIFSYTDFHKIVIVSLSPEDYSFIETPLFFPVRDVKSILCLMVFSFSLVQLLVSLRSFKCIQCNKFILKGAIFV